MQSTCTGLTLAFGTHCLWEGCGVLGGVDAIMSSTNVWTLPDISLTCSLGHKKYIQFKVAHLFSTQIRAETVGVKRSLRTCIQSCTILNTCTFTRRVVYTQGIDRGESSEQRERDRAVYDTTRCSQVARLFVGLAAFLPEVAHPPPKGEDA